jgi:polyhydroxybutyrate depolymerase
MSGATDRRVSIPHGGILRHYLVHVPPGSGQFPLVMMLHGAGGSAGFAADETGWSRLADTAGFAVVYPEGMPVRPDRKPKFLTNPQAWTDGSGRGRHDDVGFLVAVLDDLRELVDPKRIYVTGFSNGAGMTFRLAAEHAERIAAIAPVAGHCPMVDAKPVRPIPTFYLIGDADPLAPLTGGTVRTPWGKAAGQPPISQTFERWASAIDQPPGSEMFPVKVIPGLGHHWPGGKGLLGEELGGPVFSSVDATAEIWEFFRRHSLA